MQQTAPRAEPDERISPTGHPPWFNGNTCAMPQHTRPIEFSRMLRSVSGCSGFPPSCGGDVSALRRSTGTYNTESLGFNQHAGVCTEAYDRAGRETLVVTVHERRKPRSDDARRGALRTARALPIARCTTGLEGCAFGTWGYCLVGAVDTLGPT